MILEADWVVPISSEPITGGAVCVREGEIIDVGPANTVRERYPGEKTRVFDEAVLLPGFVNAHSHLEHSVFRGLLDDYPFGEWLLRFIEVRRRLGREEISASALLGAMECVSSGITTTADTGHTGEAAVNAANLFGLRLHAYLEVFGMDDSRIGETLRHLDERLNKLSEVAGPLVQVGVSPHAPYTVSGPLYRALMAYALGAGVGMATHLAESGAEVQYLRDGSGVLAHDFRELVGWDSLTVMPTGATPVKYLEQWGALNPSLTAVHCVQVSPDDIEVLKEHDVAVAHCCKSNAKLACGIAPVGHFLEAGLRVGLGTDSLASNNILDMFAEMREAILMYRASRFETEGLQAGTALRMATLGGAEVLGIDDLVGTLEPGKRADLIAVDMKYSHFAPIDDPISALVYGANQEDVFFSMIDGRVVYDNKEFKGVDGAEITKRAAAARVVLRG
jgi:5-methylthioadenosine/S-adenosylhomocysteine deaminase